ncbi:MAG: helix-turn-helix domain-containing protein, partial [Clostridia bacterium]|nr:helix-turn-helix domain-containing protein [Clostridia bacterium]
TQYGGNMNTQKTIKELFKKKLSIALKSTGKTAKEIAEITGLNYSSVTDYMKGASFPNMKNLDTLLKTLDFDEKEIIRYDLANDIIDGQKKK